MLVREDGTAVLMDFGSGYYRGARALTHQPPPPGTPQYQSPESLRFQWHWRASRTARYEATPADDLYALGVTAYRLVTGRYPPPAVDVEETEEEVRLVDLPRVPPERWVSLSPELARLIHQLLSPEPQERGSVAEAAQLLERAARTTDPRGERLLTSLPVQALSTRSKQRVPRRFAPVGARWLAAAVGVSLAIGAGWIWHYVSVEKPAEVAQSVRDNGQEDGSTVGLGEAARSLSASGELPEPAQEGISLEMPKKPFPGQRRPPCVKPEVEVNGGCWVRWSEVAPPCGDRSYEWRSQCFVPLFGPPRPPTSEQP